MLKYECAAANYIFSLAIGKYCNHKVWNPFFFKIQSSQKLIDISQHELHVLLTSLQFLYPNEFIIGNIFAKCFFFFESSKSHSAQRIVGLLFPPWTFIYADRLQRRSRSISSDKHIQVTLCLAYYHIGGGTELYEPRPLIPETASSPELLPPSPSPLTYIIHRKSHGD